MAMTMDERIIGLQLARESMPLFSATCLKISTKDSKLVPFEFNHAQIYAHNELEAQLSSFGRIRALILKGRQQGISTYVGARYYHRTSLNPNTNAFIVAHEDKATANLFKMVKRYHQHNPLAPSLRASNAQELVFEVGDSGYKLATAGSKDVGRSNTVQLLHGSEFGFWDNAQTHLAGIGNTVGEIDGTEIILESTGNGLGNAFHLMWQQAEMGQGDYIPIFIPWFWEPAYRAPVKPGFILDESDRQYQDAYKLSLEQMAWRRAKIQTYGVGFEWLFDQEYPACPALAFQTSTSNPLISPSKVMQAVNSVYSQRDGAFVIGVDPAEEGYDRTAIVFRHGRVVFRVEYHEKLTPMQIAGKLRQYQIEMRPDAIFIDKGGLGAGIYSRMLELNMPDIFGVNFGERARDSEIFENRRAEMWWGMRDWLDDAPNRIVPDAALQSDLSAPQPDIHSSGRKLLESKKAMKKRGVRSPDGGDALALTFYEPIVPKYLRDERHSARSKGATTKAGY